MSSRPSLLKLPPFPPEQESLRSEWRNLCFALERLQADALLANTRDKYEFAKSYAIFGAGFDALYEELTKRAERGDFEFFVDRGMAESLMTFPLVERMLADWFGAIASKKSRLDEAFSIRYGEDIDEFLVNPRHAAKLAQATALDSADALLKMPPLVSH
jgi:hypothetical protein